MRRHSRRRPRGRPQRSILLPHTRLEKGGNQLNYFRWFCELFSEHQPPNYASLPPLQITPKAVEVKATYITSNPLRNRLIFRTKIRLHRPISQPRLFPTPHPLRGITHLVCSGSRCADLGGVAVPAGRWKQWGVHWGVTPRE